MGVVVGGADHNAQARSMPPEVVEAALPPVLAHQQGAGRAVATRTITRKSALVSPPEIAYARLRRARAWVLAACCGEADRALACVVAHLTLRGAAAERQRQRLGPFQRRPVDPGLGEGLRQEHGGRLDPAAADRPSAHANFPCAAGEDQRYRLLRARGVTDHGDLLRRAQNRTGAAVELGRHVKRELVKCWSLSDHERAG